MASGPQKLPCCAAPLTVSTLAAKGSQAPRRTPAAARRGGFRFRSKFDAMNRAKRSWACGDCYHQVDAKPTNKTPCPGCGAYKTWVYLASKLEARRFNQLAILAKRGEIRDIEAHPTFELLAYDGCGTGMAIGNYVADFGYYCERRKRRVVEDVKHPADKYHERLSKLKIAIYNANHDHPVEIVNP